MDCRGLVPERIDANISRRYKIGAQEIGAGGNGKVSIAEDREIPGRRVAVKTVKIRSREVREAFQREVLIMKDLVHPNICKLLETYDEGRKVHLVMELCEGGDVFDRIAESGPLPESTVARLVLQVSSALRYAHNKGIAHRDLKPENVVFCCKGSEAGNDEEDYIKVIDWGVGHYFSQSRMRTEVGSVAYMAPEVLGAESADGYTAACDLWSLGVLAHVSLSGALPFNGNISQQLAQMREERLPMQGEKWEQTSDEAKNFIGGLLRRDPSARLGINEVIAHPWLTNAGRKQLDETIAEQVLTNMRSFRRRNSHRSRFFAVCVASVAQQLDHRSLQDVRRVFQQMDVDCSGSLSFHEVKSAFEKVFGVDSEQAKGAEELFSRLDLDGSGKIDYSEFCAAGVGDCLGTDEGILRAAFQAFDFENNDGLMSRGDVGHALHKAGVGRAWSREECGGATTEIFATFDRDGDGLLDFQEWLGLMRDCGNRAGVDAA
jgi:calcium-dependent protein kinase